MPESTTSRRSRSVAQAPAADDDAAALGIADGVGDQVLQHALEQHRVASHADRGCAPHARRAPCAPRCGVRPRPRGSMSGISGKATTRGPDHARLDPRDVQHAVEKLLQRGDRKLHAVHHAHCVSGSLMRSSSTEAYIDNRLHRLAQVVARRGEEPGLRRVRGFGLAARLLQPAARGAQARRQPRHVQGDRDQHQEERRRSPRGARPRNR